MVTRPRACFPRDRAGRGERMARLTKVPPSRLEYQLYNRTIYNGTMGKVISGGFHFPPAE